MRASGYVHNGRYRSCTCTHVQCSHTNNLVSMDIHVDPCTHDVMYIPNVA